MLALAMILVALDYLQTLTIATETWPDGSRRWVELNPLLGRYPSRGRVHVHFGVGLVALPVVACLLPDGVEIWFLATVVAIEAALVANNHRIGIRPWRPQ